MNECDYSRLKELNEAVLHPMSIPCVDEAKPVFIVRGDGVHVYDQDGKRYLDGMGGLWCVNVGHGRKEVNDAIVAQLGELAYFNTFREISNAPSAQLATRIKSLMGPEEVSKIFFTLGGSDSVETALKLARQFWRAEGQHSKTNFISLKHGYHGVHFGGTSLNGTTMFREPYGPLVPGCSQVDGPYLYRNPWTDDAEELGAICAEILAREIEYQGANNVAAFIAEPIQGAGGVIVPPENYWPLVRKVCDKFDVLLISDEVVTGFGRSGCLFGARGWGVQADIHCFAKGLTSGYIPLGAVAIGERIARTFQQPPPNGHIRHGYTYSGHPLACAAGLASLEIVERDNLVQNAAEVGAHCISKLQELVADCPHLGEVRGKGLMIALDLVTDKESREPVSPASGYADALAADCQENGVIVRSVGSKIILSPPLTFTTENSDTLVAALRGALSRVSLNKN